MSPLAFPNASISTSPSVPLFAQSDPEIAAGMQNPKVMKAFQDLMSGPGGPMGLMSNPAKLQEMMSDPEVRASVKIIPDEVA